MSKQRVLYYDILNILACISVVALHHNGIVHSYSPSFAWKTALIVEVGAYWSVPVFFMLTGATLMPYREKYDTKTFFKKRFARAVIPFFVWSTIVLIWKLVTEQYSFDTFTVREIINTLLNNKMENVYWFFPVLFSFYLIMPLISCLSEQKYRSTLRYAILVMFICQSTIIPITKLLGIQWNGNFALPLNSYLIFVFLGYYLSTESIMKNTRYKLYFAGICGAVIRYAAIFVLSTRDGAKNTLFFNYGYFPSVMLACAVFAWAKTVNWNRVIERLHLNIESIAKLSSCSLGIYLVHRIIIYYELFILGRFGITNTSLIWRSICIIFTYLISLAIVMALKKVPYLNKIVP